jgi:hypothetical protein
MIAIPFTDAGCGDYGDVVDIHAVCTIPARRTAAISAVEFRSPGRFEKLILLIYKGFVFEVKCIPGP